LKIISDFAIQNLDWLLFTLDAKRGANICAATTTYCARHPPDERRSLPRTQADRRKLPAYIGWQTTFDLE
jgi:hypothetical protein